MPVTASVYSTPIKNQYDGTSVIDFDTDTIKVALLTNVYVPDFDAHDFFADVSANEITGTGYTAGGVTLTTKTVTVDAATNETRLDSDNVQWTGASFTARYAVTYKDTGVAATSPLLSLVDFGADETVSSGTFTITWDATGIAKFTRA